MDRKREWRQSKVRNKEVVVILLETGCNGSSILKPGVWGFFLFHKDV